MIAENSQIKIGRAYMSLAIQYGKIELTKGFFLYSVAYLKSLELKSPTGEPFPLDNDFYFHFEKGKGGVISECYGPENIIDYMNHIEGEYGITLPIDYKGAITE